MTAGARPHPVPRRVHSAYLDRLDQQLSNRDMEIIEVTNRLRVVTGQQLERLCFADLGTPRSRTVTRSRVLARLVQTRVLTPVGRRVGGSGRGSTTAVFALDVAGQRLLARRQLAAGAKVRVRHPGAPSDRTLRHGLAVSEIYAQLVEAVRGDEDATLGRFAAEPAAWWPNGQRGWLKPDAYVRLERARARDHWWLEVDLATESLPTVRGKLQTYVEFHRRGERGPDNLTPWVLVATVTEQRRDAIRALLNRWSEARAMVTVVTLEEAVPHIMQVLRE